LTNATDLIHVLTTEVSDDVLKPSPMMNDVFLRGITLQQFTHQGQHRVFWTKTIVSHKQLFAVRSLQGHNQNIYTH